MKTERKPYTPEMLEVAKGLKNGKSKRQIAKELGISQAALRNRLKEL